MEQLPAHHTNKTKHKMCRSRNKHQEQNVANWCPRGSDIKIMSSLHNADASMTSASKSVIYKYDRRRNESELQRTPILLSK